MEDQNIKEDNNSTIRVKILDTKPSNFYLQENSVAFDSLGTDDFEFRLNIITATNNEDELIRIDLELDAFLKKRENDEQPIFGINSETIFTTPDYQNIVNKDGKITADKNFITKLLNICIGGIRGMLSVNLINTGLNHITLPLFDLGSIEST